ncbi:MAG: filamentous hemagglutinin N-terminal domain-containing protein [Myxococcota bacterium]
MLRRALSILILACLSTPASAQTSITLDGTIGGPAGPVAPTAPGLWELPGNLGQRAGPNLFYSFGLFSIGTGDTATFLPDPMDASPLSNVIARVTGGQASAIDGTLRSQIPGADFYLLNPAGVLFGGAAAVDVPASLFVSTAHRLEYANTTDFLDLADAANPTLSVEPPEAFGFTGGVPAGDIVFGNAGVSARFYTVPDGETLTAVGGNVTLTNRAILQASGGRVQLAAVGSAAVEVPLDLAQLPVAADPASALGEVRVEARSIVEATPFDPNDPQGTVLIRAGRFVLDDRSSVRAAGRTGGSGPAVDVQVAGEAVVSNQSDLRSDAFGAQPSGGVRVSADTIRVEGGSFLRTRVFAFAPGAADGGDVVLDANVVRIENGGIVEATTDSASDGGDVVITSGDLLLDDGEIRTVTRSTGNAGAVDVDATGRVRIDQGSIASTSSAAAFGGSIAIDATVLEVIGGESQIVTRNDVTAVPPPGDAAAPEGGITLTGGTIRVRDGGIVTTQTTGTRAGGHIVVDADGLEIANGGLDGFGDPRESAVEAGTGGSGAGGSIDVTVDELRITREAGSDRAGRLATAVEIGATGAGGAIDVTAGDVTLESGGQISTTTLGDGGSSPITITATGDVTLRGQDLDDDGATPLPSGVFTRAGTGMGMNTADAGSVTIDAANVLVEDGAEISTRAFGTGDSGNVELTASGLIRVAGESGQSSAITARGLEGQGGDVLLTADVVQVEDGGRVDVSSSGAGTGGRLVVDTGDLLVRGESASGIGAIITAKADGVGDAQGIDITASRSVRVGQGGTITAATGLSGGSPGDVAVDAAVIDVDGGTISTQAGSAAGGDITLRASQEATFENGAVVSAQSSGGDAGNVRVTAPNVILRDSRITADADAFGGEVTIEGSEVVLVERSTIEAFSRGGSGSGIAGGNVSILGGGVVLNRATIAADGFGNADGGNVLLSGDAVLQSTDTRVTFSSSLGRQGTFVVDSPYTEVTGDLASLPENFLDASALLEEACLAREERSGTFAVRQVGALPDSPDAPLREEDAQQDGDADAPRCEP